MTEHPFSVINLTTSSSNSKVYRCLLNDFLLRNTKLNLCRNVGSISSYCALYLFL